MTNSEAMSELDRVRNALVRAYRTDQPAFHFSRTPEGLVDFERCIFAIDRALDSLRREPNP